MVAIATIVTFFIASIIYISYFQWKGYKEYKKIEELKMELKELNHKLITNHTYLPHYEDTIKIDNIKGERVRVRKSIDNRFEYTSKSIDYYIFEDLNAWMKNNLMVVEEKDISGNTVYEIDIVVNDLNKKNRC